MKDVPGEVNMCNGPQVRADMNRKIKEFDPASTLIVW